MKKRISAYILVLCICLMLVPYGAAETAKKNDAPGFEEIMEDISAQWSIPMEDMIAGYMNLVTGEEHYWQGDTWEYCASMYKVPLNMYVSEKIAGGKLNWEKKYPKIPYKYALEETILYSSNNWAQFLWEACGSYSDYKKGVMPYMGIEESDFYARYNLDNKFTARQFITCLKTLYENPDRFPSVLDTMKEAEPERFFRFAEKRYTIAQKYGYVIENYSSYTNACGIVFTEEPIAIVMYTKNALYPDETLSAYCTAMCDYTQNKTDRASENR